MKKRIPFWRFLSTLSVIAISFIMAGCYEEEQMVSPSDALNADYFGNAVDVYGDYAIVGDKGADSSSMYNSGSAHVYYNDGTEWSEIYKLGASDPVMNGEFGSSVAIGSNFAVVGAPQAVNSGVTSGAIYIFRRSGSVWFLWQRFASPFNETNCFFGESVDIYGSYIIVGAPLADTSRGSNTGAAAIFRFNGYYWSLYRTMTGSDSAYGDWFGLSVRINENYAVVGAPYDNTDQGTDAGSGYLFSRSEGWLQCDKLVPQGSAAYARAGQSVSLNDDYVVLGAPYENNEKGTRAGSIYIFSNDSGTCSQVDRFAPPYSYSEVGAQYLGYAVDLIDNAIVAGAPYSYHNAGLVHVYFIDNGTWYYFEELLGSQVVSADAPMFGSSVSLQGEYALFGAPGHKNEIGLETGTAYIFKQEEE